MKKIIACCFYLMGSLGFSQTLPLDFESTTIPYPFVDFDGGVATKIANPQISGINTSATVMKLVKGPGAIWAGSKIILAAPIDLTTQRVFKIKVFAPEAGKRLLLKFEGNGFVFQKLSSPIVNANTWEELTFDFSSDAVNNLNHEIAFIFDSNATGDAGLNSTYLFDDVTQTNGGPILDLPTLPLDFESSTLAYPFTDFGGGETSIIPNPFVSGINTSATVVKMIKNPGETYGGSVIQMAGPIDFSSTTKIVKVKVWSPVAGKKLLLKFEGSPTDFDNGAFETEVTINSANVWEELTFDYNSPTLFPPVNNNDTKIVFFFDFGNQGDGGYNSTYYFDSIAFSETLSSPTLPTFDILQIKMYPNPVNGEILNIKTHYEQIFTEKGHNIHYLRFRPNAR